MQDAINNLSHHPWRPSGPGITAINLKTDTTDIRYTDGTEITGETTSTKSDGTTGTVAAVTLAYDAAGHAAKTDTDWKLPWV